MNPELTSAPRTDPTLLYRYRDALYAADLLIVGLTSTSSRGSARIPRPSPASARLTASPSVRPTCMLTLFSAMGLIHQRDGVFTLTGTGREHLTTGSPWYLGPYYPSLADRPIARGSARRCFAPASLRTGRRIRRARTGTGDGVRGVRRLVHRGDGLPRPLPRAVACRVRRRAAASPSPGHRRRLRDLRLRSGSPQSHLRATVLDKPPVDRIASAAIAKRGLADRVSVVGRDMLVDPLPSGADVHLFSNVLHDWDTPIIEHLLQQVVRCAARRRPGRRPRGVSQCGEDRPAPRRGVSRCS